MKNGVSVVGNFLVVFEDDVICKNTLAYAVEFTRRMKGSLSLLMLKDMLKESDAIDDNKRLQKELDSLFEHLEANDFKKSMVVRFGDKASELLKFVALSPSFHSLIWGGDKDVLRKINKRRNHWLAKIVADIGLPVVIPITKNKRQQTEKVLNSQR